MSAPPLSFHDMSWLAVRGASVDRILAVLGLSSPKPATWQQGLSAVCGDYWDFEADIDTPGSRVFISPLVEGWRLVVGGLLGGTDKAGIAPILHLCETLSREFSEACAYTTQNRMDWYSWILARDGAVYRQFLWDSAILVDEGAPTQVEAESRAAVYSTDWLPSEELVITIAAASSISPLALGPGTPVSGQGYLALTPQGRERGTPK